MIRASHGPPENRDGSLRHRPRAHRILVARAARVLLVGIAALCSSSCKPAPRDTSSAPPPAAGPASPTPRDHLADGELLEGDARAFDLTLPQGLHVQGSFADVVFAAGPSPVHPLVQYFRPRLTGGDLREGEKSATFEHVQVAQKPGRKLTIHIAEGRRETTLEVRDETPPQPPNLPDEAARWRAVGLTPNGHLIDPTHLQ